MRRPSRTVSPCGTIQLYSTDGQVKTSDASIGECLAAVFKKHGGLRSLAAREAIGAEVRSLLEREYATILWAWRDARQALFVEKQKGICDICGTQVGDMKKHMSYHEGLPSPVKGWVAKADDTGKEIKL